MGTTAAAVGAMLVAFAFGLSTFERWLARRRRHELAWTAALALFALAAGALAAGATLGWNDVTFRVFYFAGAIADVPLLALGTIYLLAPERAGRFAAGVGLGTAFAAGVLAVAPFTHPVPSHRLPQGRAVFGAVPQVLAGVGSGAGALVVLGGALWSAWRYRRGHLLWGNLLIALGTMTLGTSGLLNSVVGAMTAFSVTLTAGITILFVGFLVASAGPRPATAAIVSGSTGAGGGGPSRPRRPGATRRS